MCGIARQDKTIQKIYKIICILCMVNCDATRFNLSELFIWFAIALQMELSPSNEVN